MLKPHSRNTRTVLETIQDVVVNAKTEDQLQFTMTLRGNALTLSTSLDKHKSATSQDIIITSSL